MVSDEHSSAAGLIEALAKYDSSTRQERADRIAWVGLHSSHPPVIMGRTETLYLLNEAREVFVNGHFAATLLLAVSVIEHSLMEECLARGFVTSSPPLGKVLDIAKERGLISAESFTALRLLVYRRNPYAHLKEPTHEHGLGYRITAEKRHPALILQQDAEMAVKLMYEVFRATLREAHF